MLKIFLKNISKNIPKKIIVIYEVDFYKKRMLIKKRTVNQ